jgi:hypothetical protein
LVRLAGRLGKDRSGVMTAHVVEAAKQSVITAHNSNGLAANLSGDIAPVFPDLIRSARDVPAATEDRFALETLDACIDVPRSGNG